MNGVFPNRSLVSPEGDRFRAFRQLIGVETDPVSHKEKLISGLGGGLSILAIYAITRHVLTVGPAQMLIASMGASAVLLFAVPHGPLSQPWPVLAGHGFAAVIGVTSAKLVSNTELAAGCAVGVTIAAMHQCKFIHPPGGATALVAVIGGPAIRSLGYSYVWEPVMLNAITITAFAVAFNALFHWRRYPAYLNRRRHPVTRMPAITPEAILEAMRSVDSFLDITEDDVARLFERLSNPPPAPA